MNNLFLDLVRSAILPRSHVDHKQFWMDVTNHRWETETIDAIETLVTADTQFIDVGAWIGPTTLVASMSSSCVTAVEPDPFAYAELTTNISLLPCELASKITVLNRAVTVDGKPIELYFQGDQGGASISSVISKKGKSVAVEGIRLSDLVSDKKRTVVKIDVEGAEYGLILATPRPILECVDAYIISFHPHLLLNQLPNNVLLRFVMFHVKYWLVFSRFSGFQLTKLDGTHIPKTNYFSTKLRTVYPDTVLAQRIK